MRVQVTEDSGVSLVEVLIAIVILGICFAGLLGGMGTSALVSGVHRDQADGHTLLVSAAEALKDQSRNAFSCDVSTYSATSGVTVPDGWTASNIDVDTASIQHGYWDGAGFGAAGSCGSGTDLQRITLRMASPDGRITESLTVLKRRP